MTAIMVEAAVRSLLFALLVGAGLALLRVSNVPVRKAAWSLVLIAALAMPFLMRWTPAAQFAPRLGFSVPLPAKLTVAGQPPVQRMPRALPGSEMQASDRSEDVAPATTRAGAVPAAVSAAPEAVPAEVSATPQVATAPGTPIAWPPALTMIVWAYLAVSGVLLLRLLWGLAMAIRLWVTAERVSPLIAPEPYVRASGRIASPVTIGSGIVLPGDYRDWDRRKLRMVLAHERSHVRQMDFYLQFLAGLYAALFWFSPLGWWLRRTLATLGEAIGDRAGLDVAVSRSGYAEVLLEFAAMPRQVLPGVAMARPGNLSHRIERMLNEKLFHSAFGAGRRRAVLSLLLVPAALFGATALLHVADAQTAPQPPAAPEIAPRAPIAAPVALLQAAPPAVLSDAPAMMAIQDQAAPPAPQAPPQPPEAMGEGVSIGAGPGVSLPSYNAAVINYRNHAVGDYAYQFSSNGESYAVIEGPGDGNITFSGEWNEDQQAKLEAARKTVKAPFLWFTHEGKSYIVTDPAVVTRIQALYRPMGALGQQQEELGKQQEELGRQMEELGKQQENVQVKMPDLSKEMAELDAELAKAKAARDQWNAKDLADAEANLKAAQNKMVTPEKMADLQEKLADAQSEWNDNMAEIQAHLAELQSRLGALQGEAGARQGEFGAQMGDLGRQQGKLGAEQGRIGAEQGKLAQQADRQVRSIIDECLRNGKATLMQAVK